MRKICVLVVKCVLLPSSVILGGTQSLLSFCFLVRIMVVMALPPAQGPLPTFFGPGGGVSVLGRSSRSCSCWGGVRFLLG